MTLLDTRDGWNCTFPYVRLEKPAGHGPMIRRYASHDERHNQELILVKYPRFCGTRPWI